MRARLPACRPLGWSFFPFVFKATGAWGGKAKHLTQLTVQKYALRHQSSMKEAGMAWKTRLQLSLLRNLSRSWNVGSRTPLAATMSIAATSFIVNVLALFSIPSPPSNTASVVPPVGHFRFFFWAGFALDNIFLGAQCLGAHSAFARLLQ